MPTGYVASIASDEVKTVGAGCEVIGIFYQATGIIVRTVKILAVSWEFPPSRSWSVPVNIL